MLVFRKILPKYYINGPQSFSQDFFFFWKEQLDNRTALVVKFDINLVNKITMLLFQLGDAMQIKMKGADGMDGPDGPEVS